MAKRKAKKGSNAKPQFKANDRAKRSTASRSLAIGIIVTSVLVLTIYIGMGTPSKPSQSGGGITSTTIAPPMTGIETATVGTVDASNATVATFKMEELSGTDCLEKINGQLKLLGGIGKVRVDYSNKLCEIEYDSTKVAQDKIIEAFNKADHPGKATGEKIATP
ncbi:MAG TPA: heavy-metal-associated domain-containing protein [Anaerolineae bacterium]|jgi:copper chaperone CopZ|nr:heavy-metal-associated domain-containing protein [Anaerolineae bacterium]